MDTNSKSKFPQTLLVMLLSLVIALGATYSYEPVKNELFNFESDIEEYIQSYSFGYRLKGIEHYIDRVVIDGSGNEEDVYENMKNIRYFASGEDFNKSNIFGMKYSLDFEKLKKLSRFYIRLNTNESGQLEIIEDSGKDNEFENLERLLNENFNVGEKSPYKELVFTVPKEISENNDIFIEGVSEYSIANYIILMLAIGGVWLLVMFIIALIIPYNRQKESRICKGYNKYYLEFKLVLSLIPLGLVVLAGVFLGSNGFDLFEGFYLYDVVYRTNDYFYYIGIPIAMIFYLLTYINTVYLKCIISEGIINGLFKRSLIFKLIFFIAKRIKNITIRVFKWIWAFLGKIRKKMKSDSILNLDSNIRKHVGLILLVNFGILFFIAVLGPVGIIIGIIYTVVLFLQLVKFFNKLKIVNILTYKISQGDFSNNLSEGMGMFSPICENLNNISSGFGLAVDEEVKSQKMKTELISNVSHDLKTPLTSIITYVDLLKQDDVSDIQKNEYIEVLERKSKRLNILIEDLVEASKASSGNMELLLEDVDITSLLRQTLGELEEKIRKSGLSIKTDLPDKKIICNLDGRKTYRVFENLMSNIFKYAMPESRVYVDIIEEEDRVKLIFKNISAEEMNFSADELTERFFRGDKSRNTEGSGLGLAIAKNIVELQNGQFDIMIDGDLFKVVTEFNRVAEA